MVVDSSQSLLSVRNQLDQRGLTIHDHVDRRYCRVNTQSPIEVSRISTDEFYFPVDRGVSFTTQGFSIPHTMPVYVRNSLGFMFAELSNEDERSLPADRYSIELCAPIKLYAVVESELTISVTPDTVRVEFDEPSKVRLGARSHHEHPAATITTTSDPTDVMDAVSYFGSALKTTSCERSYPTLRGHPPLIEFGSELDIPRVLDRPETGVTIELPPELETVVITAPLAFYLGANVRSGEEARLVTDDGFTHTLAGSGRGFDAEIERILKQVFFLDCLTRTEGYYQVNLHERHALENKLDLDFYSLYGESLQSQLERYLAVDYDVIEPHIPKWKLTAHVTVEPSYLEALPFLIDDLAVIRSSRTEIVSPAEAQSVALSEFMRGEQFTRSTTPRPTTDSPSPPSLIRVPESDSIEQAWIGENAPLSASKAMVSAFQNNLDRTEGSGDIEITVVSNDTAMDAERDLVNSVYGSRDELPFDVEVHRNLTTHELEEVLQTNIDFFHYIGHIDSAGFECLNGKYDVATLDQTGVDAFFLNACTSYRQGVKLIQSGSIAGVVTLQDVINSGAEAVGKTLARLLNRGFPLRPGLGIAKTQSIMGGHYLVIGNGNFAITQTESGIPSLSEVTQIKNSDKYELAFQTYPTEEMGVGAITIPYAAGNDEYYLTSGMTGSFTLSEKELFDFLDKEIMPVEFDNELTWSNEITL